MSDEGYIAVNQGEERNYGTVGMADEEQPTVGETANAPQVRRDVCLTSARATWAGDLYSGFEGGWSTQLIVSTPTQPAPFELPPSIPCCGQHGGGGGELKNDGLDEIFVCLNIFSLTHSSPTGAPAEKVPRGDFEDLEAHSNESSSDLPNPSESEVGAHRQSCSLHCRQVDCC